MLLGQEIMYQDRLSCISCLNISIRGGVGEGGRLGYFSITMHQPIQLVLTKNVLYTNDIIICNGVACHARISRSHTTNENYSLFNHL